MCVGAPTASPAAPAPMRRPRLPRPAAASPRVDLNRLWGQLEQLVPCHVSWAKPQAACVEGDGDDDNAANENRLNEQKERAQRERDRERRRRAAIPLLATVPATRNAAATAASAAAAAAAAAC